MALNMYGHDQHGLQSRLARDMRAVGDRHVSQTQISQWLAEGSDRAPPPWLTIASYHALVAASDELHARGLACRRQADRMLADHLSEVPAGRLMALLRTSGDAPKACADAPLTNPSDEEDAGCGGLPPSLRLPSPSTEALAQGAETIP
jgi:hypothetical protein